jgi:ketosteroid isomerase-like protein
MQNTVQPVTTGGETMQARSFVNDADIETLEKLNGGYMKSVQSSDVRWFENNLAEDFLNSNPDGSLVDRTGFLEQIARPATLSNFEARDVRIRIMGDIAIIHGRTTYAKADGRAAAGRYTDVWARRQGRWQCVAAHVTRG